MRRRALLRAGVAATAAVAGCLGAVQSGDDPTDATATTRSRHGTDTGTTTTDPTTTRSLSGTEPPDAPLSGDCYANTDPVWAETEEVRYGSAAGFELTASRDGVHRGESVTFDLTNVADETRLTGNRRKFAFQHRPDDRWGAVLRAEDGERVGFTDEGVQHDPGEGFSWTFALSADALAEATGFTVCAPLPPGDYRFVYWGMAGADVSLAVRFTLTA